MAEVVGLVASVVQLAGAGLKLSETLYHYVDGVATADRRIQDIAKEVKLTSSVIQELGTIFEKTETANLISENAVKTANETFKECFAVFTELDLKINKGKPGKTDKIGKMSRLMLPFKENKIELLRSQIEKLKSTLQLLMQILIHAHQVSAEKYSREAEAKHREEIKQLLEKRKQATKKYEESLRNLSISDGSTAVEDDDRSVQDEDDIGSSSNLFNAAGAIGSTINPDTIAACVDHVRSLLADIETLQLALTKEVDGNDHSDHHQKAIGSYFIARSHLDSILLGNAEAEVTDTRNRQSISKPSTRTVPSAAASHRTPHKEHVSNPLSDEMAQKETMMEMEMEMERARIIAQHRPPSQAKLAKLEARARGERLWQEELRRREAISTSARDEVHPKRASGQSTSLRPPPSTRVTSSLSSASNLLKKGSTYASSAQIQEDARRSAIIAENRAKMSREQSETKEQRDKTLARPGREQREQEFGIQSSRRGLTTQHPVANQIEEKQERKRMEGAAVAGLGAAAFSSRRLSPSCSPHSHSPHSRSRSPRNRRCFGSDSSSYLSPGEKTEGEREEDAICKLEENIRRDWELERENEEFERKRRDFGSHTYRTARTPRVEKHQIDTSSTSMKEQERMSLEAHSPDQSLGSRVDEMEDALDAVMVDEVDELLRDWTTVLDWQLRHRKLYI